MLDDKDLEKLGKMMDKRFDAIDVRFATMDKRFDAIDVRFATMDKRFETQDNKIDRLRQDIIEFMDVNILPQIGELRETLELTRLEVQGGFNRVDKKFDMLIDVLAEEKAIPKSSAMMLHRLRVA
ncbi:MAG: protein of unknown function DUF16 [Candidatus Magasanikbacteria bacterium]|nr:protein of unknown function DUF16 [Candidatus Magasanikbacteria bacterium]